MSLNSVNDGSFRTVHPVSISPRLLTRILRGAQSLPGETTTPMHVFSVDEARFLSPLISKALSQAAENQLVTFHVLRGKSSEAGALGGTIYIQGRLLHFTLTYYHVGPDGRGANEGQDHASRHPEALELPPLAFIPETDERSSTDEQQGVVTPPPLGTLVIDYQMFGDELDRFPPTAQSESLHVSSLPCPQADVPSSLRENGDTALQETPSHGAEETLALKELVCEQAIALDALKEDMRVLRHRLSKIEAKKHKSTKPGVLPAPRRRVLEEASDGIADPSCNSIRGPLTCQGYLFSDLLQEIITYSRHTKFHLPHVDQKPRVEFRIEGQGHRQSL